MTIVEVRSAVKYYKNSKILNNLNLTVNHGSIYGLIGASGCGKTTILSCILGMKKLDSGSIKVLDHNVKFEKTSKVAHKIGFMPQEISLIAELTIKETLYYFGNINQMDEDDLHDRYEMIKNLLELPDDSCRIENLSGGQQRRISLAVAIIHDPQLMIFDEPTCGLDSLLREKIWSFLIEITRKSKISVIITTHYIAEAQNADCCGLMRNGKILAEDSPNNIMSRFGAASLDEAFLNLCLDKDKVFDENQNFNVEVTQSELTNTRATLNNEELINASGELLISKQKNLRNMHESCEDIIEELSTKNEELSNSCCKFQCSCGKCSHLINISCISDRDKSNREKSINFKRHLKEKSQNFALKPVEDEAKLKNRKEFSRQTICALLKKEFLRVKRQPAEILYILIFPIFQMIIFSLAIGKNPIDLKIAIVNNEMSPQQECTSESNTICQFENLSCRFLDEINDTIALKVFYNSFEEAFDDAKRGEVIGIILFPSNLTDSMKSYKLNSTLPSDDDKIQIYLDQTNLQITSFIYMRIYESYKRFNKKILKDCNMNVHSEDFPLKQKSPIYGSFANDYTLTLVPCLITQAILLGAVIFSSSGIAQCRIEGVWNRTLLSGVTQNEILLVHIIFCIIIDVIQVIELIISTNLLYHIEIVGNVWIIVIFFMVLSFVGSAYGILISIVTGNYLIVSTSSIGFFQLTATVCGAFWPLEGQPIAMRYFSYLMPTTIPSISVRNIIMKGFGFSHPSVWLGMVILILWIVGCLSASYFLIRRKKFTEISK